MSSPQPTPPLVVFDCSLFLQAVLSDTGPAFACFELMEAGKIILVASDAVMVEVRDVLTRPNLVRKYPKLAGVHARGFLLSVSRHMRQLDEVPEVIRFPRDPKDEPYLNLAIAAGASYLVTRDLDLLELRSDDSLTAQELRSLAPTLSILDPPRFLQLFQSQLRSDGAPG